MKRYPYQWLALCLMTMAWGISGLVHNCVAFLFPFFSIEYSLGTEHNGYLTATIAFFWTVSIIICGKKGDKYGQIQVMMPCLAIGAIALFGLALLQNIVLFYIVIAVAGFGCGSICSTSLSFLAEQSDPQKRGLFYGVAMSSFTLIGSAIGSLVFTRLGTILGWRSCFMIIGTLLVVEVIILFLFGRRIPRNLEVRPKEENTHRFTELFAYRNVVISTVLACLIMMWYFTTAAFTILYLIEHHAYSTITAGAIFAGFGIGGFLGEFTAPIISDYIGRKTTALISSLAGTLCFAAFMLLDLPPVGLTISIAAASYFLSGAMAILNSVVPSESVPSSLLATATSFSPAAGEFVGGMIAPVLAGILIQILDLTQVMHLLLLLPLFATVGILLLKETAPRLLAK